MTANQVHPRRFRWLVEVVVGLILGIGLVLPVLASADPPIPAGSVRIHSFRPDGSFTGWTLWTWGASTENQTAWCSTELQPAGVDSDGAYWDVTVNPSWGNPPGDLGFIVHNCSTNTKDPGPDQHLQTTQHEEAWDVAMTGCDGIPMGAFTRPSLTTVAQDTKRAGELLVHTLVRLIEGEPADCVTLAPRLIVRGSCGAAPAEAANGG